MSRSLLGWLHGALAGRAGRHACKLAPGAHPKAAERESGSGCLRPEHSGCRLAETQPRQPACVRHALAVSRMVGVALLVGAHAGVGP